MMDIITLLGYIFKPITWIFGWLFRRPRLRIRIIEDRWDREIGSLVFEVENISHTNTSLTTIVDVSFLTIYKQRREMSFDVRELDRNLPPFTQKIFNASAREIQQSRATGWFRTYIFKPSKGMATKIRIKNASLEKIGMFRFFAEKYLYKIAGKVILGETSMTIDEYNALRRSRGPH